jgi:hypothetical protein
LRSSDYINNQKAVDEMNAQAQQQMQQQQTADYATQKAIDKSTQ